MTTEPCDPADRASACGSVPRAAAAACPFAWFEEMIPNCLEHAREAKAEGRPIVGIMCEYTPREIIMAAGGVPVCLCGGSAETIEAAETELPSNLCPLIKSTYGYHVEKANPFLEMADLVVAETTCDGKKKMFELLARSRPMHVLELPQKQDGPAALDHWLGELAELRAFLERRFSTKITDCKLAAAIRTMNEERRLRRALAQTMRACPPPMTGRELIALKSSISGIPRDLAQYRGALETVLARPPAASMAQRVRVLMTGVPMAHGAERVLDIVEDCGGVVVAMENCTGLKPILEDVDETARDPMRAIAEKYVHLPCSVMTPNARRMQSLRELVAEYRPQCVIDLSWQACLTYDVESVLVRDLVENELRLPYLRISTDYSPSDSARIALRVEALYETVRGQSAAASRPRSKRLGSDDADDLRRH